MVAATMKLKDSCSLEKKRCFQGCFLLITLSSEKAVVLLLGNLLVTTALVFVQSYSLCLGLHKGQVFPVAESTENELNLISP